MSKKKAIYVSKNLTQVEHKYKEPGVITEMFNCTSVCVLKAPLISNSP